MIKLQAIGNLGRDAVKNEVNGKTVINFSLCHTEKFKDAQGNTRDKSVWVDCAYWTDKTGILPYLVKGSQLYVDGIPDVRNYTTGDGKQGTSLTLRVNSIQLIGGKADGNTTSTPAAKYQKAEVVEPEYLDSLPF